MKKIISLILLVSVLTAALCACGAKEDESETVKAPDAFIQADADNASSLVTTSGDVQKNINTPEYAAGFAKAYNAASEFLPYGIDMEVDHTFILSTSGDEGQSAFFISRVAAGMFNVSVDGVAAGGETYRFRIVNSELEDYIKNEIMAIKNIDVTCHVKFVIGAGTPAEDGSLRTSDETVFECDVTQNAPEDSLPTVLSAVTLALASDGAPDHAISKNSGFPSEIAGLGESVTDADGKVTRYFWKYFVGDAALESGGAAVSTVSNGDTVTVIYTASEVDA